MPLTLGCSEGVWYQRCAPHRAAGSTRALTVNAQHQAACGKRRAHRAEERQLRPPGKQRPRYGSEGNAGHGGCLAPENVKQNPHEVSQCSVSCLPISHASTLGVSLTCQGAGRTKITSFTLQTRPGPPSVTAKPFNNSWGIKTESG